MLPDAGRAEVAILGFVGLEAMGGRMAARLLAAGHDVRGYNRTPARARALTDAGLTPAASPRAAAEEADGVQMLALAEAVVLAERAGISRERAVETLLKSVAASPMLAYRGPFVLGLPAEAMFDVTMIQKDLRLALELGRSLGVPLPATGITNEIMTAARRLGVGRDDFAVVFDVIARLAGVPPARKLDVPDAAGA